MLASTQGAAMISQRFDNSLLEFNEVPIPADTGSSTTPPTLAGASVPLSSITILNSLPGAVASLYLSFVGRFDAFWGSYSNITTPAFDQDGDPTSFSSGELSSIETIWESVSEDYAPFNINVTTVAPPSLINGVTQLVAIGGSSAWTGGSYGGISYVDSFTSFMPNVSFVFSVNLGNNARYTAEAASHEAGHAFGLQHQMQFDANGTLVTEYYAGPGDGRAPIMGNSYSATRGLWWYGPSGDATSNQDDMSVIASSDTNGFGYRPDDHGNTASTATALTVLGSQLSGSGVITTTTDVDYFSFTTDPGQISLSVDVPADINNLDARLELRDSVGTLIASASPTSSFNATITATVAAGSYRLVVGSNGGYGDVGQYTVSGTIIPSNPPSAIVLHRQLFYNDSKYDNGDANINSFDDEAIAIDKVAYFEDAGDATFDNVSSYTKGINGIIIDIAGSGGLLLPSDFIFKVGNSNSPDTWAMAPPPTAISVRVGAGIGGSDRVELVWPNQAIKNTWLQVTVAANANTGLATPDVFYFGSAVGDSGLGDNSNYAIVSSIDEAAARANPQYLLNNIPVTNIYDYDRGGSVNSMDESIARLNPTNPTNATRFVNIDRRSAAPEVAFPQSTMFTQPMGQEPPLEEPVVEDRGGRPLASAWPATQYGSIALSFETPPWLADRLVGLSTDHAAISTTLECSALESLARASNTFVAGDEAFGLLDLDASLDMMLDSIKLE
jgi:hypothetical protein